MKISLSLISFLNDHYGCAGDPAPNGIDALTEKIGAQLGGIEEVIDTRGKYQGIKVVEVIEAKTHFNADKLSVYKIFDGANEVQVVSGDTKLVVGDKVAWLAPDTTVPSTWGTDQPFVLSARDMRGEISHGMFASGKELAINDDDKSVLRLDTDAPAGTPLAEAYPVEDLIIDVENKMFTHRPDCFGQLGVAREIAGIQNLPFSSPDWYQVAPEVPKPQGQTLKLEVKNQLPQLVERFTAIVIKDVKVGPSPLWMQTRLTNLGVRPINNIVDITNFFMLETGQPLHAYDYDKVTAQDADAQYATLTIRHPQEGESLNLLNGKQIEPRKEAIMIASANNLIGVGGVMGGADTEVDETTKNIILECATFNMYSIRRTSMEHGLFTDAVARFNKGQSPLQNMAILAKAVDEILQLVGGEVASEVIDDNHLPDEVMQRSSLNPPVVVGADFINNRLGTSLQPAEMATILSNTEFAVEENGNELNVTAPFWRTDIEIAEDIVEEVGRLFGYDNLPHKLPNRPTSAAKLPNDQDLKERVRTVLSTAGANELHTYSFVPARLFSNVGQDKKHAFVIRNAISPELEHYRMSITPSLLEKVHPNIKAGYSNHALFEINKVHIKGDVDCEGLPREYQTIAFVCAAAKQSTSAYYDAKNYLEFLLKSLHIPYEIVPAIDAPQWEIGRQIFAPFEPKRSAYLIINDEFGGFIGEYNSRTRKNLKLPEACAGFEIDLERLLKYQKTNSYQPLLKFPSTEQDVCFKVKTDVNYGEIVQLAQKSLSQDKRLRLTIAPLDIYQRPDQTDYKQITLRITLQHHDRTLTTTEVNEMLDTMVSEVITATAAERV